MSAVILNIYQLECELGEGVLFSQKLNCVYWVDIKGQRLYRLSLTTQQVESYVMPEPIGWVKETAAGHILAGFKSGIYWLNGDFTRGEKLLSLTDEPASNRLNDAKTDRQGRLYFGSMDDNETEPSGHLYQLDSLANGAIKRLDGEYIVSNGPAVNRAGTCLYSVSSAERRIYAFTLGHNGELTNKRVFLTLPQRFGYPDGITIDSQDNLWIACWTGHGVCCYSPQGQLIQRVILPAPLITNITFAGEGSQRAFVTSARTGLSAEQLARFPLSGSVFELHLPATGLADTPVND